MRLGLFLEGFGFDYAHFLPFDPKCSRLHGHSAEVRLRLFGQRAQDGMLVPFDLAREALRDAVSMFDHRLLAARAYIEKEAEGCIKVSYVPCFAPEQRVEILLPRESVLITPEETTIEHVGGLLAEEVLKRLPGHVVAVELEVSEGRNKGVCIACARNERGNLSCQRPT